ncbi:MAG TPA: L-threonylcarbamoyladenylate synthase [Actinomycetota bacterium]|nr:L-threonylcarbamoyladenylate synthase [Actinomycetota bacterium]
MAGIALTDAVAAIRSGTMAIIPTDTVYGIAALPEAAVAIFDVKRRPRDKALPVLGSDAAQLGGIAELDDRARALADEHWPGPLTIVVRRKQSFAPDLGGDDPTTVAVRVPAHPVAQELLRATGPLAVTSANVSGEPPATTYEEACALAGGPGVVCLDGGTCDGVPSTVLSLVGEPRVLRRGALDLSAWLSRRAR